MGAFPPPTFHCRGNCTRALLSLVRPPPGPRPPRVQLLDLALAPSNSSTSQRLGSQRGVRHGPILCTRFRICQKFSEIPVHFHVIPSDSSDSIGFRHGFHRILPDSILNPLNSGSFWLGYFLRRGPGGR